jgi:hypothetical protein
MSNDEKYNECPACSRLAAIDIDSAGGTNVSDRSTIRKTGARITFRKVLGDSASS